MSSCDNNNHGYEILVNSEVSIFFFFFLCQSACNMRQAGNVNMAELLEKQLASELSKMTLEEALILARAFSHYLTLMGIAETHHR